MDLITLTLNKNHILSLISIIGVGTATYLANRYISNTKQTNNQTYYKPIEVKGIYNINNLSNSIIYIYWNGDINSTYILLDLLLQDKIIQPLYIERYTIIKDLEKDTLINIAKNKHDKQNNHDNKYLNNIVLLKKTQDYEIKQLEVLRLLILKKYSEFTNNLLPTTYITTISKDLDITSTFYNILYEIKPIYYDGIDFIEQILRYIKHSGYINNNNNVRIILGCNKDYKNYDLLIKLINKNIVSVIELPLKNKNNEDVHYLSTNFFSNDIMKYFLSKKNTK